MRKVQPASSPPPAISAPAPTRAQAAVPSEADLRAYETALFEEINHRRAENGVPPIEWDERLAAVARAHSEDMARRGYFGHVTPEGSTLGDRLRNAGLPASGEENILVFSRTVPFSPKDEVSNWMNSPDHRAAMLNPASRKTGIGVAVEGEAVYVTQDFLYQSLAEGHNPNRSGL